MTIGGGAAGDGTIFSEPISGGTPTLLASFTGTNGSAPFGSLTANANGSTLFGMTSAGGANSDGTIFSIVLTPEPSSLVLLGLGSLALGGWPWGSQVLHRTGSSQAKCGC